MITTTLAVSGAALYMGSRGRFRRRKPKKLAEIFQPRNGAESQALAENTPETSQHLALSVGMMGVTTVARISMPLLGLATLPVLLYLNLPFLQTARGEIVEKRRAGIGVLDSVASLGMLALGKLFADALFLSLYFLSRRLVEKTRNQMREDGFDSDQIGNISERELLGERLVDYGSLPMLVLGAVTWPLLGASQAVAVLVNYFGYDLRVVAPISVLSYLQVVDRSGVTINDGRALESLHGGEVLFVFDADAVSRGDGQDTMAALLARNLAVVSIPQEGEQNTDPMHLPAGPEDSRICFVGSSLDSPFARRADVIVSWDSAPDGGEEVPHILLPDDLTKLAGLVDVAAALDRNIKTSAVITAVPALFSLAGIYFLHFGVVTAIVIDYLGLGLGMLYAASPGMTDELTPQLFPDQMQAPSMPASPVPVSPIE